MFYYVYILHKSFVFDKILTNSHKKNENAEICTKINTRTC